MTLNTRPLKVLLGVLAAVAVVVALSSCGSNSNPDVTTAADAVVIDVRTFDEYAAGHLEGAQLTSVEAPTFAQDIAELDPDGTYLLYCRSGNRAGVALDAMVAAGFTDVTNLGSVEEASEVTGRKVVQ